jgi:hypothetical protein
MPCKQSNWAFLLLCSISFCASAATIHKWVDDDGVTHFSDAPPAPGTVGATTVELSNDYPLLPDANADYYSIANQWNRMRQEREAKDQLSLEKARIQAEQRAAVAYAEAPLEQTDYESYYPVYGLPGRRINHHGAGFRGDRRNAVARGPHHVQPGHGRLSRSHRSHRSNGSRAGRNNSRRGGAGFSFGFSNY